MTAAAVSQHDEGAARSRRTDGRGIHQHHLQSVISFVGASFLWAQLSLVGIAAICSVGVGQRPVMITGGSMRPAISRGDVIIVKPVDPATLKASQLIMFDVGEGRVTHRIVEFTDDGEAITKGDANAIADTTPVPPESILGRVRVIVPSVGLPLIWWQDRAWKPLAIWVGLTTLAVFAVLSKRRTAGSDDDIEVVTSGQPQPATIAPTAASPVAPSSTRRPPGVPVPRTRPRNPGAVPPAVATLPPQCDAAPALRPSIAAAKPATPPMRIHATAPVKRRSARFARVTAATTHAKQRATATSTAKSTAKSSRPTNPATSKRAATAVASESSISAGSVATDRQSASRRPASRVSSAPPAAKPDTAQPAANTTQTFGPPLFDPPSYYPPAFGPPQTEQRGSG